MEQFIKFRQEMHRSPEISGNEIKTAEKIKKFMKQFHPNEVFEIGKTSLIFVFDSKIEGNTTVFRADIDALPIQEQNVFSYVSDNKGVAHLCGHDGHTSILLALASRLARNKPQKGKIALLFQAAEETGQGAKEIVESETYKKLKPDFVFGLHNIPGYPLHQVLLKKGSFAAASKGMIIKLFGKTSHAAEPENGINPALAVSQIINEANQLISKKDSFNALTLLTFVHISLGEIAFGTSAGYAELCMTLRAFENSDMKALQTKLHELIFSICKKEQLGVEISYTEVFPATENHNEAIELVEKALQQQPFDVFHLNTPFKWSEDFGHYLQYSKGAFWGLGAGKDHSALHNSNYNFPDELIETGAAVFYSIAKQINYQ